MTGVCGRWAAAGRAALAVLVLTLGPATAETVALRAGEHPGFARLVVEFARPADWTLGRIEGGYALDPGRAGVSFASGEVYRFIGRDRIAALEQRDGRLLLRLGCDCHATAAVHRGAWIVVDVADGPAPPDSRFETALAPPGLPDGARRSPPARPPQLAAARADTVAALAPSPTGDAGALQTHTPAPPAPPASPAASHAAPHQSDPAVAASSAPGDAAMPPVWTTDWNRRLGTGADVASPPVQVPREAARPHPSSVPDPGHDIPGEEAALLGELARAAAQGLLDAATPDADRASRSAALAGPPPADPPAPEPTPAEAHLRLSAETSIDRSSRSLRAAGAVSAEGTACLPDAAFDIPAWGDPGDPAEGIAARREGLVGEFDRPAPEAVAALARYYLYLGFGAEARATVAAFPDPLPEAATVAALASVLDGERAGLPGPLAGQTGCPGRAALWSLLAAAEPVPAASVDRKAVFAAFSNLPPHLRRLLGAGLAERFLAAGDHAGAVTVRNALLRAPGDAGAAVALLDARLGLSEGDAAAARALPEILQEDDAIAPEAYALYLETALAAGEVPDGAAATADALAFDIAGSETADRLATLAVDSRIAEGDFDGARREILRLPGGNDPGAAALWSRFALGLARGAQDAALLRQAFAAREALAAGLAPEAASALAARLTALGFPEEALRYLPPEVPDAAGRAVRAEALLATGKPAAAFGTLAGLEGAAVETLRGKALAALGDAGGAADRFARAGEADRADRAALAAGDWSRLASSDDPALAALGSWRLGAAGTLPEGREGSPGTALGGRPESAPGDDTDPSRVAQTRSPAAGPAPQVARGSGAPRPFPPDVAQTVGQQSERKPEAAPVASGPAPLPPGDAPNGTEELLPQAGAPPAPEASRAPPGEEQAGADGPLARSADPGEAEPPSRADGSDPADGAAAVNVTRGLEPGDPAALSRAAGDPGSGSPAPDGAASPPGRVAQARQALAAAQEARTLLAALLATAATPPAGLDGPSPGGAVSETAAAP